MDKLHNTRASEPKIKVSGDGIVAPGSVPPVKSDGQTLDNLLQRAPLLWKDALHLAISLCEAAIALNEAQGGSSRIDPRHCFVKANRTISIDPLSSDIQLDHWCISPECTDGSLSDQKSVVYTIACIIFRLLTGRIPERENADFQGHLETLSPNALLNRTVACALSLNPSDRYPTVVALQRALRAANVNDRARISSPKIAATVLLVLSLTTALMVWMRSSMKATSVHPPDAVLNTSAGSSKRYVTAKSVVCCDLITHMDQIVNRKTKVVLYKAASDMSTARLLYEASAKGVDLRDASLRKLDLRAAELTGMNLQGCDFSGSDLWGNLLRGCNLQGTILHHVNLGATDLTGANLSGSDIDTADFSMANMQNVRLERSTLKNVSFATTKAKNASFVRSRFENVDFTAANLAGSNFEGVEVNLAMFGCGFVDLSHCNFTDSKLKDSDFVTANMNGVVLDGAKINCCSINYSEPVGYNAISMKNTIVDGRPYVPHR